MQQNKDFIENDNMRTPIIDMDTQKGTPFEPNNCPHGDPRADLYSLCIGCPDWPRYCNGPKLSEFLDIMLLRNFMRKIRDYEKIKNKQIADKTHLVVSEATVAEFFSNKVKDFMWTTVAHIDHAMKQIVLERQLGTDFDANLVLDNPCPASSSNIQEMMSEKDKEIAQLKADCQKLQNIIDTADAVHAAEKDSIYQNEQLKIRHLIGQITEKNELYAKIEETAEKRYGLIVDRDKQIAALQKTTSIWRTAFIMMLLIGAVLAVLLAMYLVWDYAHPGSGVFW